MAYHYEAVDRTGKKERGSLEASSRAEALGQLQARGLQPFVLEERGGTRPRPSAPALSAGAGPVPLRPRQLIAFTEELADLLHAGLQLEPALHSMTERDEASALRQAVIRIRDAVREGVPFSEALRHGSPSFGELYVSLAHAGEVSGSLPRILRRQAVHLRALSELRSRVTTTLTYPAFLVLAGVAVAALFSTFLIPRLAEMLERSGADVPPLAGALIRTSEFLRLHGAAVLAACGALVLLAWRALTLDRLRSGRDRWVLRLPLVGPLLRANFHVQWLETLGNLTLNGLPLLKGLQLAEHATANVHLRAKLAEVTAQVADGMSLSRALKRVGIFPAALTDMVRVGEQTGQMGSTLERAAQRYDRELSETIARLSAAIQPLIIVLMAGMVGSLSYLMISVIYDTISTLRAK
jgi:type II secretory pathway component PulF